MALFTSVPVVSAIIRNRLQHHAVLQNRKSMTVGHIIILLEFCLKNTYFLFHGRFYEQVQGVTMGSPINPIVANLYMEDFKIRATITSNNPPRLFRRDVGVTSANQKTAHKKKFQKHINSINPCIQFTTEKARLHCSMPSSGTLVITEPFLQQCTEKLPTMTCIYIATAIATLLPNIVQLTSSDTENCLF